MASLDPAAWMRSLESDEYLDLVVDCQGVEFKAHRLLLCRVLKFFAVVCSDSWRIISREIVFIYTNDHDWSKVPEVFLSRQLSPESGKSRVRVDQEPEFVHQLHIHLEMYKSADYLGIEGLKTQAAAQFFSAASVYENLSHEAFAKPLRSMFEGTTNDSVELRWKTAELCLGYRRIKANPDTLSVLEEHGAQAWKMRLSVLMRTFNKRHVGYRYFD